MSGMSHNDRAVTLFCDSCLRPLTFAEVLKFALDDDGEIINCKYCKVKDFQGLLDKRGYGYEC